MSQKRHPNRFRAKSSGEPRYWTDKPCANGHDAPRYTSTGKCVVCHREAEQRQRVRNPENYKRARKKSPPTPTARAARRARRRAKKRDAQCACCLPEDFREVYAAARERGWTVDHIIPLAAGGPHCLHNLQILPRAMNAEKRDRYDPLVEGIRYLENLGLA